MAMVSLLLSILSVSGALAQCSRNPDLFITAPQKMEALRGSCLQIPCTFRPESEGFDSNRASFGVWIKNDSRFDQNRDNVIFNGTGTVNKYAANITGNLSQKNCTTLFSSLTTANTDSYFFRIENERFKATASCHPVQINVRDSAPSPRIHISGDQKENESVGITCSAVSPCPQSPPTLSWTLRHESQNKLEQNTDGTFTVKIQETITLSDKDDGRSISCSAMYPVNEGTGVSPAEGKVTLSVSYVPKDTSASISPSGGVSAGTRVNLTCSSRANPPISRFTWFKQTTGGSINVSERDIYSFNATDEGVYFCVATNALGNQTSPTIRLNFNDSAPSPRIHISGSDDLKENESVGITCSAVSPCPHSPPTLNWTLRHESQNKLEQNTDGTFTVKIQETITLSDKDDGRSISCSAMYPVNEGTGVSPAEGKVTLSVSYAPKDTSASISPSGVVSAGNLTCSSRANPPISRFTWFKQIPGGSINVSEDGVYGFNATDEGVYFCVATNALGNQTSPTIRLNLNGSADGRWEPVLGGIFGIILLVCLGLWVWRLKMHPAAQKTQSQTAEELPAEDSARKTEEENIHYGEINFSRLRPEPSSVSLQDSGQQQDTVYAQVNVSQTGKRPTQTADGPEDIYSQVKKK
ncbi:sialoadhesin-like [Toxotes jaculatrix]|uniref:sialoadhesin-like n=1 Tax=Toxotes jaculatrix TaxID=941984 RepID=UPI001B3A9A92|nr:sialoadhesin-like [Toxotes jaculatrix]